MTDKNPLAHYSGVLSEAEQESAAADVKAAQPIAPEFNLKTSAGGRGYVSWYFSNVMQRHDFGNYITKTLAADFACALSSWLRDGKPRVESWAAPAVVAVPDERAAFEKWASFVGYSTKRWQADANLYEDNATEDAWIAWQARAALAATPTAAAQVVLPEPVAYRLRNTAFHSEVYEYFRTKYLAECRQKQFNANGGSLHELTPIYTEQQLRALLAGVSAPAAQANTPDSFREWFAKNYPADTIILDPDWHAKSIFRMAQAHARLSAPQQADAREAQLLAFAVSEIRRDEMEHEPVLYVSKGQLDNHRDPDGPNSTAQGRYLPARVTPSGKFTTPLFAAPQAHADARDAGKLHFWVADDPDTAHESLHEAVMEAFETNGVQPGGFVEIQREISLPNILVRITSTKPFAFEEVPDATIDAQAAQQGGAAC